MMLLSFVQTTVLGGVMIAVILLLHAALKGRLGAGLFRVLWALAALRLLIPRRRPAPPARRCSADR